MESVMRPAPFAAIAFVFPDMEEFGILPPVKWFDRIAENTSSICLWDQAGFVPPDLIPQTQIRLAYPTPVRLNGKSNAVTLLPQLSVPWMSEDCNEEDCYEFLSHLARSLKPYSQVWVTIKASDIYSKQGLLHATDAACVLVPASQEGILPSYEAIKSITLSGYFAPLGILQYASSEADLQEDYADRIKKVAKRFLTLDLVEAGVIFSSGGYEQPEKKDGSLGKRILELNARERDFLYCLFESVLYREK